MPRAPSVGPHPGGSASPQVASVIFLPQPLLRGPEMPLTHSFLGGFYGLLPHPLFRKAFLAARWQVQGPLALS